jgi:hypothetical protein
MTTFTPEQEAFFGLARHEIVMTQAAISEIEGTLEHWGGFNKPDTDREIAFVEIARARRAGALVRLRFWQKRLPQHHDGYVVFVDREGVLVSISAADGSPDPRPKASEPNLSSVQPGKG